MGKKLIYIANYRIPTEKAHGMAVMKMCKSLSDSGAKVELLLPRRINPIKADSFEYYGVKKNFKIVKLPTLDLISLGFGRAGFFIETFVFLLFVKIYLIFASDYERKHKGVYSREPFAALFFKDISLEIHSLPLREARLQNFLFQKILKRSKKFFVLTSFIRSRLVKTGVPENKIIILPDAVDLEQFDISISKEEARKKINLPQDKKIILYTGSFSLYDWKGVDILLEAAQKWQIPNDKFQTLFVFVGGGEKEINELKKKYNLDNVLFIGYKLYTEIPIYLKAADVLVLPNKKGNKMSEEETSPLKLFEYMASGRPIVASDLPSIREILTEEDAVFFNPNDAKDLSYAIKNVLANEKFGEEISEHAYAKVKNYTWGLRAGKILNNI